MADVSSPYYDSSQSLEMIKSEKEQILAHRARGEIDAPWTGLALSGGGIRSAIFCLGALQALANKNILGNFDYISSVSGGGYIATALQWWWKTDTSAGVAANFPFGTSLNLRSGDSIKDERLAYLRWHGQYLTPGEGITIWSAIVVALRTLFLNLLVWIPLGAFFLTIMILAFKFTGMYFDNFTRGLPNPMSAIMEADWKSACNPIDECHLPFSLFFLFCFAAALLIIFLSAIWALAFSLDTRISPKHRNDATKSAVNYAAIGFWCAGIICILLSGLLYFGHLGPSDNKDPLTICLEILTLGIGLVLCLIGFLQLQRNKVAANYVWRRQYEVVGGTGLIITLLFLTVASLPILPHVLTANPSGVLKALVTTIAMFSGIVSAVYGHRIQAQNTPPGIYSRIGLSVASGTFIYSTAIISYFMAQLLVRTGDLVGDDGITQNIYRGIVLFIISLAWILSLRTNINYVGFHRFYRDRLMEAFMPAPDCLSENVVSYSTEADGLSLVELWPQNEDEASKKPKTNTPYPIINTNAILINDRDRKLAWRGGDNFILSPLYTGCTATGWERTWRHIAKNGPLSVASAMAASGAATNSNSAYVGAGITRDPLVSIVMMLLNIRLGMWVGSPSKPNAGPSSNEPNHISPGFIYGMARQGYKHESSYMELSDGGHFDNLGIYELVRRQLSVVLVLDGEADPTMSMPALFSVAQRVNEDFGATIDLHDQLDALIPKTRPGFPNAAKYAEMPYFVAPITYSDNSKGILIYVKLAMAGNLSFVARGYKAQNPDFPHQPTANQFFVPEQVEAYREIGYKNMMAAIEQLQLRQGGFTLNNIETQYDAAAAKLRDINKQTDIKN